MNRSRVFFNLNTKIIMLVWVVVALALLVTSILTTRSIARNIEDNAGRHAAEIARITAHSPVVIAGLQGLREEADIQAFTAGLSEITDVLFIVVFDRNAIRKSHPDRSQIGQHVVGGDEQPALDGQEYISTAQGTLGRSLRAFCPIFAPDGGQVGAVVVGIHLDAVQQAVVQSRRIIYLATALGLLIGAAGAMLLARNIKKQLFGLEPAAIARLVEERSAMLQSVREGILAVDKHGVITVANDEALRILHLAGLGGQIEGQPVEESVPNTRLTEVLSSGLAESDQEQSMNGVAILTNRVPLIVDGKIVGAIATFRDMTEIRQMAEELTGVRSYVEALRSQAHEFMNKMHVILGMVHMQYYDELAPYISRIAHAHEVEVTFVGKRIKDPVLAGILLSKLSRARELGVNMVLAEDSFLPETKDSEMIHELVTIVGNLVDNALEAVEGCLQKRIEVRFTYLENRLQIMVSDTGTGIGTEQREQIFVKGYSSKAGNHGIGLALVQYSLSRVKGSLKLKSTVGEGTAFWLTIPYESIGEEI